jgi:C-terminal peptidase prc
MVRVFAHAVRQVLLATFATALAPLASGATPAASCPIPSGTESGPASRLSLFSKTLFYMREYHPQYTDSRSRDLLLGALAAMAAQDSAVRVKQDPGALPRLVTVTVDGHPCTLSLEGVNAPWNLRSSVQQAVRFAEGYLAPKPSEESTQRMMGIEFAATNGMLSALDGHSQLLDPETYRQVLPRSRNASVPTPVDAVSVPAAMTPKEPVIYLRLRTFRKGIAGEVQRALAASESQPPRPVILDLRDNPGGFLDEAAGVADAFIKDGALGSMVSKRERKDLVAHPSGHEPAGALVVLVNRRTASGSELVAAAVKNLGRGVVLGELTAGAGSIDVFFDLANMLPHSQRPPQNPSRDVVQNILDDVKPEPVKPEPVKDEFLGDPYGLRLMNARLLASGGAEIDRTGVRPDIELVASTGRESGTDNDCVMQFALTMIAQASNPQRSTLLATAKALPIPTKCGRAPKP